MNKGEIKIMLGTTNLDHNINHKSIGKKWSDLEVLKKWEMACKDLKTL